MCRLRTHAHRVYTLSKTGKLLCQKALTGEIVWKKHLAEEMKGKKPYYGYACSPLIIGQLLIVTVGKPGPAMVALKKKTGEPVWEYGKDTCNYSSPVSCEIEGRTRIIADMGGAVASIEAATGKEVWRPRGAGGGAVSPVVSADMVFVSASGKGKLGGGLKIIDDKPGLAWKNENMKNFFQTTVLFKEHLYGTHSFDHKSETTRLRCVELKTGEMKWEKEGLGHAAVTLADGRLLILTETCELLVIDADATAYREISRAKVFKGKCWTTPVLSNGRIYCRNIGGDLVCLDVKEQ